MLLLILELSMLLALVAEVEAVEEEVEAEAGVAEILQMVQQVLVESGMR